MEVPLYIMNFGELEVYGATAGNPSFFSDTLFYEDFTFSGFIESFHKSPAKDSRGALVACYNCKDEGTYDHRTLSLREVLFVCCHRDKKMWYSRGGWKRECYVVFGETCARSNAVS